MAQQNKIPPHNTGCANRNRFAYFCNFFKYFMLQDHINRNGERVPKKMLCAAGIINGKVFVFSLAKWLIKQTVNVFFTIHPNSFLKCYKFCMIDSSLNAKEQQTEKLRRKQIKLNSFVCVCLPLQHQKQIFGLVFFSTRWRR